jgi:hypothetical protein
MIEFPPREQRIASVPVIVLEPSFADDFDAGENYSK